ncbi:MAG: DUF192 domain-containing protein [archaeon]|nr:DUF192 domain-containing protein [archaeon]
MKTNWLVIIVIVLIIALGSLFYQKSCIGKIDCLTTGLEANYQIIKLNDFEITAKIADNPMTREQGLMNLASMPEDSGMLFIFDDLNQYDGFWMKDTHIPLDIIFIDDEDKVTEILQAMPCVVMPCETYIPKQKTFRVLEVNKGLSDKVGLKINDKIEF